MSGGGYNAMLATSCKNKAKVVQMEDYKFGCSDFSIYLLIKKSSTIANNGGSKAKGGMEGCLELC